MGPPMTMRRVRFWSSGENTPVMSHCRHDESDKKCNSDAVVSRACRAIVNGPAADRRNMLRFGISIVVGKGHDVVASTVLRLIVLSTWTYAIFNVTAVDT